MPAILWSQSFAYQQCWYSGWFCVTHYRYPSICFWAILWSQSFAALEQSRFECKRSQQWMIKQTALREKGEESKGPISQWCGWQGQYNSWRWWGPSRKWRWAGGWDFNAGIFFFVYFMNKCIIQYVLWHIFYVKQEDKELAARISSVWRGGEGAG